MQQKMCWLGALSLCALAGSASAQISRVDPFTGPFTESFEGPQVIFTPCVTQRVFNGRADLCTPGQSGCHTTGGWGFMCSISRRTGTLFFGSAGGFVRYTFDNPITKFGGYFGTNCGTDNANVTFYDASMNPIGQPVVATTAGCTWTWNGWESTVPFKSIDVVGNAFGGAFIDMDDMEYDIGGGGPVCYPDCNADHALNVNDFVCFQSAFAASSPTADCNHDNSLNVNDFVCFQSAFAAGCSSL
jgi:hypothetical protein